MAIFTNAVTLTGNATDDFLLGDSAATANTIYGGDGNDYIIGDADTPITMTVLAGAGTSAGNAFAINDSTYWSQLYNPDVANSTTVPHATAIIEGNNTYQWFSVTVVGGQILTLDVDYGRNTDIAVQLYQADGITTVAGGFNNNAAALTDGAGGSSSLSDSFLTFTAPGSNLTSTTYLIRVAEADGSPVDANESYMLNFSLTEQATDTPSTGNDVLYGGNGNDVIYGIGGNDVLYGGAGNDTLTGDAGNDTLDGGAGNDQMYGGDNNDTFAITNGFNTGAGDQIYGGAMTDTLDLSALTGLTSVVVNLATGSFTHSGGSSITTIVDVENVVGTAGNDTITGSDANNTLFGGAGDDTMTGGNGTDKFYGGAGNDTFFTNSSSEDVIETAGEGTADRVIASATFSLEVGSAVEIIQTDNAAGTTAINLTGNALAQTITGNAANNALNDGGAGAADTLIGGAGNDTYYVNNAGTIIVENAVIDSADRVAASISFTLAADDDIEQLSTNSSSGTSAINLTGNALKQAITGNAGDNILNTGGGAAADTLTGAAGNDTYVVNNAADVIVESSGQGTADRVTAAVSFTLDSSDDIEILATVSGAATTAINLTGNALVQTVTGNAGANVLDGKGGNDILTGGLGNDTFSFSSATSPTNIDTITDYTIADDQIELSETIFTGLTAGAMPTAAFVSNTTGLSTTLAQRIIYNSVTGALMYDVDGLGGTSGVQIATLATGLAMTATEFNIVAAGGGSGGNIINGTSADNTITGTAVADTIYGFAGNDTITGGLGNDLQFGGTGNDTFIVQGTSDVVTEFAGEGINDVVQTAATFELTAGSEVEVIQTTNAAGTTAINLTGNALAQSITGNAGINSLSDGAAGAGDTLTGLAGNDIYYVSNATTIIVEAAGGGTVDRVAAKVSFVLAADDDIEQLSTNYSAGVTAINLTGNALTQIITGNAGDNILNTGGGLADTMAGLTGNDTYVVRNAADVINEGTGQGTADRVSATTSFVLDAGDDIEFMATTSSVGTTAINLTGNLLAQSITGNAGDNRLDGKGGIDILTGNAGNDTFVLSSATGVSNVDTITDYNVAADQIELGNTVYTALTPGGTLASIAFEANATGAASTTDQRIIYNTATGALMYDADGLGGAAAVQIATLSAGLVMTASEFTVDGTAPLPGATINGTAGNDNLVGTTAGERINGLAGNDTINGGLGNDTAFGGAGNDIFIVEGSGDIVTELAGEGTNDVVLAAGSFVLTAGSAVELIQTSFTAGTTAINLTGNALAQTIIGNAGANQLNDGGAGAADTMTGLAGNDIYYVANSGTIINEVAGAGTADRVASSVSFTLAADDDIELLTTSLSSATTAINLTGNALAQQITGNAGNNVLNTGGGAADSMTGLAGNDTYQVQNAGDVIIEVAGQGTADRVNAAVTFVLDASDDIEILATANDLGTTAQNLTGNAVAQMIIGNAGINTLNDGGGAGADTLIGGAGNDLYLVNNAGTTVIDAGGGSNDVVTATTSFTLTAGSEVEIIQTASAIGLTAINFTGNALAQSITGNQGANILNDGATGAADTLTGLEGEDIYVVNNSGTIIVEAVGQGTADEVRATVNFALAADDDIEVLATNDAAGTAAINLSGNALFQTITGNAGNNVLDSGVGAADTMTGGLGNDTYLMRNLGDVYVDGAGGGTADEVRVGFDHTLLAGTEIEILSTDNAAGLIALTLTGNALAQTINGNAGADTLIGLGGDDTYTVNNTATTVIEAAAGGTDRVNASVSYTLGAGQEIETLATTNDAGIVAVTLTGNALAQTIIGNNAASTLVGLGGNDVYTVNNAGTVVTEAAAGGADTVNASVSYVLTAGSEVEILQTTSAAGTGSINLTGNALSQQITGNAGANTLDSFVGVADTLTGLGGNDIYFQRNAGDVIVETTGNGTADDLRVLDANFTLGAGQDIEILSFINAAGTGVFNLTGNLLAQTISGNAGVNTLNDGGGAADILIGLAGSDTYLVNNAGTQVIEAVGGGADVVTATTSFTLNVGSEVETIQTSNATLTTAINLTGNALVQTITGNAGVNILSDGAAGVGDTLVGLAGNDVYIVNNATTVITETTGNGTADQVITSVNYVLAAGVDVELFGTSNAAGTGAINLTGNALSQQITGNAGANTFDSVTGVADTMTGLAGNDIYIIRNAADVIIETAGNGTADDVRVVANFVLDAAADIELLATTSFGGTTAINLTGNALAQSITGNAGVNFIDGKLGNDVLFAGNGADTFVFSTALNATTNLDTISDFVAVDDTIQLSNAIFATLAGTIVAADFLINTTGVAATAAQNIIYNSATGGLFYDADGLGGAAGTQFATLTGAPTISLSDFTVV